jgi:hypothetical protein
MLEIEGFALDRTKARFPCFGLFLTEQVLEKLSDSLQIETLCGFNTH